MKKWSKKAFFLILGIVLLIQVVRPERSNPSSNLGEHIQAVLAVPPEVAAISSRACNDCHSNNTLWPWYSNVAPFSWVVVSDVRNGRSALNFSEWGAYDLKKQQELLKEICEQVKEGEMPEAAYLLVHPHARLSGADREAVCSWTRNAGGRSPVENDEAQERSAMRPFLFGYRSDVRSSSNR